MEALVAGLALQRDKISLDRAQVIIKLTRAGEPSAAEQMDVARTTGVKHNKLRYEA
jgi:hypothetical protein